MLAALFRYGPFVRAVLHSAMLKASACLQPMHARAARARSLATQLTAELSAEKRGPVLSPSRSSSIRGSGMRNSSTSFCRG